MRPDVTEKFERSLRSDSTKQMPGEEQLVPMGGGGGGLFLWRQRSSVLIPRSKN